MIKKIINKINSKLFKFNPTFKKNINLIKIGTTYGGYDIIDENLKEPIVLSCGLGEDASFDVDMINNFNAKVFVIDPTPRSKIYFNKLKDNFGSPKTIDYNESGYLKSSCYDLRKVNMENLIFIDKAIWSENNTELKLYYPIEESHVSLSINKKKNYSENSLLKVQTINYDKIIELYGLKKIDILKLDIEGAEVETLKSVLKNKILPNQILVEFDLRRNPSLATNLLLKKIHQKVCEKYDLININNKGDFTYLLK